MLCFARQTLWNGNNWTPILSRAALRWAIVFWHEEHDVAVEVLRMVNDILWLHYPFYYMPDGTPVEGISYSYMSIAETADLAAMHRSAFGFTPAAIDAGALEATVAYTLASMGGAATMVDFGDSHATAGFDTSMLLAASMQRIVTGNASAPLALDACGASKFNAVVYGSYGNGPLGDPWVADPHLAPLTKEMAALVAGCGATLAMPMGGLAVQVFPDGGLGALRSPLLPRDPNASSSTATTPPCFGALCVHTSLPAVADLIPYARLALNARDSSFTKSELDYGTLAWTAWGQQLLAEFGYGTIASTLGPTDYRRAEYIDNNPAGHNTVVVKEAFQSDDEEVINFSQLSHVAGTIGVSNHTSTVGSAPDASTLQGSTSTSTSTCVLLDGSSVYGSQRPDGWLDTMRRYACPVGVAGTFVVFDVLGVKANRQPLVLKAVRGPSFDEGSAAHARLHVEEYFYVSTAAVMKSSGKPMSKGASKASRGGVEHAFNTAQHPRASVCSHVDPTILGDDASRVLLRPACGMFKGRGPDGLGLVSAFAAQGGGFVYDGLITTEDRYFKPHSERRRRFRFVGNQSIGVEGDVRAFALATSPAANRTATPEVRLASCSSGAGCKAGASALACSCIAVCTAQELHWAVVVDGRLLAVHVVVSPAPRVLSFAAFPLPLLAVCVCVCACVALCCTPLAMRVLPPRSQPIWAAVVEFLVWHARLPFIQCKYLCGTLSTNRWRLTGKLPNITGPHPPTHPPTHPIAQGSCGGGADNDVLNGTLVARVKHAAFGPEAASDDCGKCGQTSRWRRILNVVDP